MIVDSENRVTEISKVCSISDAIGESVGIEKMDAAYSEALFSEQEQYQAIERDAGRRLVGLGTQAEPESLMARAGMWMGMQMKTFTDTSTAHLANLLIQGSTMGVTELTRSRNEHGEADAESVALCDRLIKAQQDAIERAKGFLV